MENNILSHNEILNIVNQFPDNFTQIFRSKKNYNLYGNTFSYINSTYDGIKFSEKLYKHVYGEKHCKKCNNLLTSKQFRSFFDGYVKEFCSKKCALHSIDRITNIKKTKLERYGNSSYNNLPLQQKTMMNKYGVTHNWNKNSISREKCYDTNEKLHGSRTWNNPEKSIETKIKNGSYIKQVGNLKKTCREKYGCDFVTQTSEMKEKSAQTNLKNFGVRFPSQHPDIVEKCYKNWKLFTYPSGNEIKVQGYEPAAINLLLKTILEDDIITKKRNIPEIWYILNNDKHRYYPDIFVKSQNKFIEVKSEYTFQSKKEETLIKHNTCLEMGYLHEIWIFNKQQTLVETIKTYASK
jgi:hypothetical protein